MPRMPRIPRGPRSAWPWPIRSRASSS
jgi:hypothetical protein